MDSLVGVSVEHFAFLSAESGDRGGGVPGRSDPSGSGLDSRNLGLRVDALETMVQDVAANVGLLVKNMEQPVRQSPHIPKVKFKEKPVLLPSGLPSEKFPGLDPSVVAAALSAGVTEENLTEMQRMLGSKMAGAQRLREPALRKKPGPTSSLDPDSAVHLSEEEEEEGHYAPGDGFGSADEQSPSSVAGALNKLTEIFTLLNADKLKKARTSKLDLALDSVGGGTGSESSIGGTVKRAAAARRTLRAALQESPQDVSAVVERLMAEDLNSQTQFPGMPEQKLNARAWLEHRSRVGAYKTSAFCAWSACGILDDLIQGRVAHARARAGLLVLQLDQCAIDRGSWTLAAELGLEPGPPLAALANHTLPSVSDGESPFSKLLDARWAEVMLSHLREAEDYVQKRKNLGRKTNEEGGQDGGSRPKAKAKPKAKASAEAA